MSARDLCCPQCGGELTIEQVFGSAVEHRAFTHLAVLSVPLGARVLAYLQLFAPAKNRLTIARKVKLIEQLLPDLQRQAVNVNGRDWEAPLAAWAIAIDGMLAARDAEKLRLPLTGHAYLYAVLQGMADKVERSDEQQRERDRKQRTPSADLGAVLDELGPDIEATRAAIANRGKPAASPTFLSAADVLKANPHLAKGGPN